MDYLSALKILEKKRYKFNLIVLGDGSLRKKAEDFCLENQIDVHFMGFIKDINQYISNSDFVFTSRYLGILEALALKKFVFAHYNNKIKEDYLKMFPFSKFISISKNSEELVKQINFFLKDKGKKNQMVDGSFNWVISQTWREVLKVYLKLWRLN